MSLFSEIMKMILPVIIMIIIGFFCNKKQIINQNGLEGLKNIIGNITLPVVLFNAFYNADYNLTLFTVMTVVFLSCGAALITGRFLSKSFGYYGKFLPFLLTCFEGGMLGYALFGLIAGNENQKIFASVDIGQTLFAYTIYLAVLKSNNGEKMDAKKIVKNMATNPPCIGMFVGIICGITGVDTLINSTSVGAVFNAIIAFVTAPTAAIILIIIGYELSFKKEIMKPVIKTVLLRLVIMAIICTAACLIVFAIVPYDKNMLTAIVLLFSLPAPFVIPFFANVDGHAEYISTTLSVCTIVTVVCFIGITIYNMA